MPKTGSRSEGGRPVRKDEIVIEERGLYVESWLPERRSRRRPLYLLHGELGGSWVWERYLGYFAGRGWEGHALNLRGHFWSETAEMEELTMSSYIDDALAGYDALARPAVVIGHGLGGLLALKVAEQRTLAGMVLISPALPAALLGDRSAPGVSATGDHFRRDEIGWAGPLDVIQRNNRDLTLEDVARIQHLMGAESVAVRREMLAGVEVDRSLIGAAPCLVIGGGLDRQFSDEGSEQVATWLEAEYQPYGAHSHYGLVLGEHSFQQVAEAIRTFLDTERL